MPNFPLSRLFAAITLVCAAFGVIALAVWKARTTGLAPTWSGCAALAAGGFIGAGAGCLSPRPVRGAILGALIGIAVTFICVSILVFVLVEAMPPNGNPVP